MDALFARARNTFENFNTFSGKCKFQFMNAFFSRVKSLSALPVN